MGILGRATHMRDSSSENTHAKTEKKNGKREYSWNKLKTVDYRRSTQPGNLDQTGPAWGTDYS